NARLVAPSASQTKLVSPSMERLFPRLLRRQQWTRLLAVWLMLCVAVTGALYLPGLSGPFVHDDFVNLQPVLELLQGNTDFLEALFGNGSGPVGRPVSMLTFLATAGLGPEPFWFKLGNLALHLVCGGLVFLLARRLYLLHAGSTPQTALGFAAVIAT